MAERTLVSIYEVDVAGSTGSWMGAGSLVHPEGGLARIPFNRQITERRPSRLRVGLATPGVEAAHVEVIDVDEMDIDSSSVEPLVALALTYSSNLPPDLIPGIYSGMEPEAANAAIIAFLKGRPTPPASSDPGLMETVCAVKPWWKICKARTR